MKYDPNSNIFNNDDDNDENQEMPFPQMQSFLITPKGPIPIPANISLEKLSKNINHGPCCSIFNGEYLIYLIDQVNEFGKILLECKRNPEYSGNKYSLFDVYQYFSKTHFLNFMLSKIFNKGIWAYEGADIQIQILHSKKDACGKMIILIQPSECPQWVFEYGSSDVHYTSYTNITSQIPSVPLISKVIKGKSYYAPVISYDVTLGFTMNTKIDFDHINLSAFYNIIIGEYINDALSTFYPGHKQNLDLVEIGEKLIRVNFKIEHVNRLMNLKIICSPAVYGSIDTNLSYKYSFIPDGHLISVNPINDRNINFGKELMAFSNKQCSSPVSQVISISTENFGIISHYCEDYYLIESFDVLFIPNRLVGSNGYSRFPELEDCPDRIFSNIDIIPSKHKEVIDYWKPKDDINIYNGTLNMKIYGFVNFIPKEILGKSYNELFEMISGELSKIIRYNRNEVNFINCYESFGICRVLIYSTSKNDTNTDNTLPDTTKNTNKKFKWFGGD